MAKTADRYFKADPWKIIEERFDPSYARVSESVFSLANESIGVRGYFDENGTVDSLRGSYINGVYDIEQLPRSYRGTGRRPAEIEITVDSHHFQPVEGDRTDGFTKNKYCEAYYGFFEYAAERMERAAEVFLHG